MSQGQGDRTQLLVFAYACEPGKGSEPAAGWVCARMLAQLADVWVITRRNNRQAIDASLPHVPERENLHFEYVDLPSWMRTWKRGGRGARLYYFLWQLAAVRRARQLLRNDLAPDFVWHLTWGNAWLGSLAPLLPHRFIYGPVGGGTGTAWRLWRSLGWRGNVFELARTLARFSARYLNPIARLAWHRADLILVQNPETHDWLPARHRWKVAMFPHAVLEEGTHSQERPVSDSRLTALYVGRLVPWKGVALAIEALTLLPEWRLVICGSGPDERRLRRMAMRFGVANRTDFRGWLPRDEVRAMMAEEADVLIFPSLHDDAPFAVAEALAANLPVICLDRGGPPVLGGTPVETSDHAKTIAALADGARRVIRETPPGYPDIFAHAARLRSILLSRLPRSALRAREGHTRTWEVTQP